MRLPRMTIRQCVALVAFAAVDFAMIVQRASHPHGGPALVGSGRPMREAKGNLCRSDTRSGQERFRPLHDHIGYPERFLELGLCDPSRKSRIASLYGVNAELIGVLYILGND
jgi:hypothetical protein